MAIEKAPAFSFYAKDFMLGTLNMSLAERGAYITLLAYQWDSGSVPADALALSRVLGCSRLEAGKVWPRVSEKFKQGEDGAWRNDRLELERTRQAARRDALAANGRLGGRPPTKLEETKRLTKPEPNENQKQSLPSPSPSPSPIVVASQLRSEPSVDLSDDDTMLHRAAHLLERYAELFQLHRRGARYHNRMHLDFMKAQALVKTWADDARLEKLAEIVLTTDDEWISRTDRGFGVFAARATWADDRLTAWEADQKDAR